MSVGRVIGAYKDQFDPVLAEYLDFKRSEMADRLGSDQCFEHIEQGVAVALAGGKRVRPFLVQRLYEGLGGQDGAIVRAATLCAEIFHVFCLIHDDIIDRAAVRHGLPTVHTLTPDSHQGQSQAILVGDLFFAWAYELAAQCPAGLQVFQKMIEDVVAGQMLDTSFMVREPVTAVQVLRKNYLKTASYTFVRPLQLGAALAGAGEEVLKFCENFGGTLGLAFQLQDDLLDITGQTDMLGKAVMKDIREGQQTFITTHFFERAEPADLQLFQRYFGQSFEVGVENEIKNLLEKTGSLLAAKVEIDSLFEEARGWLARSPLPPALTTELGDLTDYLAARSL